ncbi:isopentenyl-diphosphate Delta-isomerase [Enterobacter sp. RHBSTW-00994]|uniref:isopentenyl-diphosphate Delta-isomerase n=1 Tax=Enterobacteriaceae TaxID=543 RepID=UPI0015EA8E4D|nr:MULTISPECIES: isopentenyl-diphosphate Delta-isomerase [Enterobacteriaceae]MBM3072282.1 isopentenyl-diphosphate Delta-isomerase [Lelliottia sp. RWM.1]QLR44495.1 isopentenyl-diphosphate Delta-isomerase [Enterobacter sp. RHBSTW-00994]
MSTQEHVILLSAQGEIIGIQEKYAAHTAHTPLHLAFSSWLFNAEGKCLITRRALSKKAWPGVWTNAVCGHPQTGETLEQAIIRRCRFEVGAEITTITPVAPEFRYRETDPSGIVENEICPVFAARVTNDIIVNVDEVMEYQWVDLESLFRSLDATPWAFSPWMVKEATTAREKLRSFSAQ